eukprot:scaffold1883_cov261-Pinguiococcus_pyrenoidosus.AAC.23
MSLSSLPSSLSRSSVRLDVDCSRAGKERPKVSFASPLSVLESVASSESTGVSVASPERDAQAAWNVMDGAAPTRPTREESAPCGCRCAPSRHGRKSPVVSTRT